MTVDTARLSRSPISAERWPDVARVPSDPLSVVAAPIADRLFRNAAARLPLRMIYPDGTVVGAADATLPTMVIHRPDRLARRIGRYGLIGFGESYMAGEWSSDDLAGVLTEFATSVADLVPRSLQRFRPIAVARQPRSHYNSREQAREQRLRALRPVERAVRRVPRRDDDLLQRPVRYAAGQPIDSWPTLSGARSTDCSTRRGSAQAVVCWKSERAGANCAFAPPPAARKCDR